MFNDIILNYKVKHTCILPQTREHLEMEKEVCLSKLKKHIQLLADERKSKIPSRKIFRQ